MPNVLGFSLGGYAIFLAIGDHSFRELLTASDESGSAPSPFLAVNAVFVHFILVQIAAIVFAVLGKANLNFIAPKYILDAFSWFSYFLFIYALLTALAATLKLFMLARQYEKFMQLPPKSDNDQHPH